MNLADLPLHGVAIYNPDLLSKQELCAHFIARRPLLDRLLTDLGREGRQHHLLIGQRGMGKTTLLRRLRFAIEDDPRLASTWLPLTFPEEQYNVARLSDLYLNIIDAVGDALDRMGRSAEARALDEAREKLPARDERERERQAIALLRRASEKLGRRLLLLIDNIDLVFGRLEGEHWALRELLGREEWLLLIGASAAMLEATFTYQEAFYDFFRIHELGGLSEEESREVLLHLARVGEAPEVARVVERDPGRIKTFHVLAGGNPRTVVLLYDILARGVAGDVRSDLDRLLDRVTPLYKSRFEELPAQSQQIVDALAIHWDPISAAELAAIVRLDVNPVSSQLSRLEKQGVVEKVAYHPGNKAGYQVAERFFNIWYLMRASRRVRQRLIWLVEFLRHLYGEEQLRGQARGYLQDDEARDADSRMRRAEYGLALAQVMEDVPLRGALESVSVRALAIDRKLRAEIAAIIDLDGADASLKPVVDRHRALVEIKELVFAAKVSWEGWNPEEFWELLGGSLSLSLEEKTAIAIALERLPEKNLQGLAKLFRDELDRWLKVFRSADAVAALRRAFAEGHLADLKDVPAAQAAALALGAPIVEAIVLVVRQEQGFAADLMPDLERAADTSGSAYALNALGNRLTDPLHRFEEAEAAYRRAIEIDPKFAYPWHGLGNLLQDHLHRFEEAEAAYRQAIEIDPKFAHPWNGLGSLQDHLHRFEEAESAYRQAIEIDPKQAYPWNNLGNLLKDQLHRFEEAEAAYRKAIEIDPENGSRWNCLAWCRFQRGSVDAETEDAARRACELSPDDVHALHTLATILTARGNWTEAEPIARRYLTEGSPDFHERIWEDNVTFFREAARTGHAADAVKLLDELSLTERWRPLREALAAIAARTRATLRRVAPEVRRPAEELLDRLWPQGLD